ncbi:DNA ligase 1 isoform X2 [Folsomia candida]|uniref:DNA ligase 1 isoform X2 n=1 Tax=Folsomia candida TaxID=158441 RepID=UPI000B905950|nr:DNA ligase 1 isoform X2 [Folsomia candida]
MSHHGGGGARYFKTGDGYGSSGSKRYHSPNDAGGGRGGGGGLGYDAKRSRSDTYGGSYHTSSSSSSARYNDYGGGGGAPSSGYGLSNRYSRMPGSSSTSSSSYYDSGLKSASSKYVDDYSKGRSGGGGGGGGLMKSSVRRIPPAPQLSSSISASKMRPPYGSSSSSRPLPLMKLNTVSGSSSSTGLGGGSRDNYGGSRLRTAPPEHHSSSSYLYSSSSSSSLHRKPEAKRPTRPTITGVLRNPYGPVSYSSTKSYSSGNGGAASAFKRGTIRAAASVTSKIRRRAIPSYEDRKKRIESYSNSRRDLDRTNRTEKHKVAESSSKNNKDSPDIITEGGDAIKKEVKLPDGEVGVVLDEVGGDSDSDEGGEKDESGTSPGKAVKGDTHDESMDVETGEGGSAEGKDKSECGEDKEGSTHDHDHDESKGKDRRRSSYDRESSPSSRALLKMYCKYCDVRHVTFREYSHHLRSFPHIRAMNNAVTDMRKMLSKVRTQQRDEQRRIEKEEKVELSDTTSYCRVCELNFRTDPKEHEANELHNEIKTLIYKRCEICDIDFRIWKVYLYHMAALEHVKRVAMKELKDAEGKVDGVKGTNLTQEELGADLVEVRTVFFCNACVRYLPIKGDIDEAKERHCMTLTHVKGVEEFHQREKKIAERQRIRMEREERDKERRLKEKAKEESKASAEGTAATTTTTTDEVPEGTGEEEMDESGGNIEIKKEVGEEVEKMESTTFDTTLGDDVEQPEVPAGEEEEDEEEQDVDEDEIELHAGDLPDDEENDQEDEDDNDKSSTWNRRTRSAKLAN